MAPFQALVVWQLATPRLCSPLRPDACIPHPDQLARMVAHAHDLGFPVAIHAVERDAVVAAALAIKETPLVTSIDGSRPQDRIEHCSECPPDVLDLVAQSGAMVVANPRVFALRRRAIPPYRRRRPAAASLPRGGAGRPGSPRRPWFRRAGRRPEPVGGYRGVNVAPIGQRSPCRRDRGAPGGGGDSHALGCQAHRVGYAGGLGGRGTGSDGGYARRVAYGPLRGDYRGRPRRVVRWYMSLTTTRPASLTVRQRKRPAFPFETRKSRPLQ